MSSEHTLAIAIAAVGAGIAVVLWLAWQRGTRAQSALRDKRALQRARLTQRINTEAEVVAPSRAKQGFGRR